MFAFRQKLAPTVIAIEACGASHHWEAVNRALLISAKQEKLERGATLRIDSTVSAALMLSSLCQSQQKLRYTSSSWSALRA